MYMLAEGRTLGIAHINAVVGREILYIRVRMYVCMRGDDKCTTRPTFQNLTKGFMQGFSLFFCLSFYVYFQSVIRLKYFP